MKLYFIEILLYMSNNKKQYRDKEDGWSINVTRFSLHKCFKKWKKRVNKCLFE